MKFHGCFDISKQKSSHTRIIHYEDNDDTYDFIFDLDDHDQITISLSKQQLISMYETSVEAVEVWTDYEIPYHV